jgi:bifunctional non-homologous end joining protein LigD
MVTKSKSKQKPSVKASDAIDKQLERYRSMRDFGITNEPSGEARKAGKTSDNIQLPFVIQKHAASHLHYDFRLGWNGVLKSWAIAKGPSYFPGDRRLAVQVEDHPIEYGGFEGIIPQGQYGGGTVMLWDQGTWEPQAGHTDVNEALRSGSLKFTMHGTKMKGNWTLVRMNGKAANERKPNWLLIKEHDKFERNGTDPGITQEAPNSVVTGRSLDEIAHNEDHVWNSKDTAQGKAWYRQEGAAGRLRKESVASVGRPGTTPPIKGVRKSTASQAEFKVQLQGTPKERFPDFIPPQLALQSTIPPEGTEWLHELKLDGYRIQARKQEIRVQLMTRSGLDWTHRMKTIASQVESLPVEDAVLDGEVVVLASNGTTSFADLQAAFQDGAKKPLTYFVFDLLHLNGHKLRGLPLMERKSMLSRVLQNCGEYLRFSEHVEGNGDVIFHKACELRAEGIISKRASSKYSTGRSDDWQKLKCVHKEEFVIGGFTLPTNGAHGIGALLLGYYKNQNLIYAGRTGTGFTKKTHRKLRDRLDDLRTRTAPFDEVPKEAQQGAIWVKPQLVAQVNFATWTADNLLRQASFQGLREDKVAKEVRLEEQSGIPEPRVARHESRRAMHAAAKAVATKTDERKPTEKSKPKQAAVRDIAPVRLTHPEKVLDIESDLTKRQLADYYWAIAPYMLPHIAERPLSLVRCPEGSGQPCFYQKHVSQMLPPGMETVAVPDKTGKSEPYITLSTREALAGMAQIGVLEVHPWGSRNNDLEHPDRIIVDLDPDARIPWKTLTESAAEVRQQLKQLGLQSFLKSTGGKGLHIVVPVEPKFDWSVIKQFAHAFALQMEQQQPSLYLTKMSKAARKDRIYIDYLRNERGATAVAAYSPRARVGVSVSLPLHWNELKLAERPVFHVADFDGWKSRLSRDPWKLLGSTRQQVSDDVLRQLGISITK